ncbi:hypothetical protein [Helicobacter rodentium]|nr:hypothetical protein [Helicobacter rodentium]
MLDYRFANVGACYTNNSPKLAQFPCNDAVAYNRSDLIKGYFAKAY